MNTLHDPKSLRAALSKAVSLARSGKPEDADNLLECVLADQPDQVDALQLRGLVRRQGGDNEAAVEWFRRALALAPDQPHVLNNLGNALMDLDRPGEAMAAYREALRQKPGDRDALVNFGLAELECGAPKRAVAVLSQAVELHPGHGVAWTTLAEANKTLGRYEEAIAAARKALALRPEHVPTLTILGVAQRLLGDSTAAVATLEHCVKLRGADGPLRCALAYAYYEDGRTDEAIACLEQAIENEPGRREAHAALNDILWQHGRHAQYLASYATSVQRVPREAGLWSDWAGRLSFVGRLDEAQSLLEHALARGIDHPELHHRLGQILCRRGNYETGLAQYRSSLADHPEDTTTRLDLVRALLATNAFEEAVAESDTVLAQLPDHQEAIAYQGIAWRWLGDPRATQLNDYDRFVGVMDLSPPQDIDPAGFNARLAERLKSHHRASHHPAEQTLRGGTQTMGNLLAKAVPEIATLRAMLQDAVARYIAALPDDSSHAFLRRKSDSFRFCGSWSVRLRKGGYHINHVHSQGWISACYYLEVPQCVKTANDRAGWLKLGETNLGLGPGDRPSRYLRPEPGRLVLFPSYFYHGTVPFEDAAQRTTIAFDVIPD